MGYLPLFLNMDQTTSLILGGGEVASTFVSGWSALPQDRVSCRLQNLSPEWPERPDDFWRSYTLVVAATDDAPFNERVCRLARATGCLVNNASARDGKTLEFGSIVRRGKTGFAIHTAGSPALTRALRCRLETMIPERWATAAETMEQFRLSDEVSELSPDDRRRALRKKAEELLNEK